MPKIFTHKNVDLDNIFAVIALRAFAPNYRDAEVVFVDASWDDEMAPGDIAIDIVAGGRGLKGEKIEEMAVMSAFALVVDQFARTSEKVALENLIKLVEAHDAYGDAMMHLFPEMGLVNSRFLTDVSLVGVYRAMKVNGLLILPASCLQGEPGKRRRRVDQRSILWIWLERSRTCLQSELCVHKMFLEQGFYRTDKPCFFLFIGSVP